MKSSCLSHLFHPHYSCLMQKMRMFHLLYWKSSDIYLINQSEKSRNAHMLLLKRYYMKIHSVSTGQGLCKVVEMQQ